MNIPELGILLILGLCIFFGLLGAQLFQRLRIPQVIGYIAIGLIIGQSGLNVISAAHITRWRPLNLFALGIIGFLVGGELQMATFKKYARQFVAILLGEGLLAFVFVGGSTALLFYRIMGDLPTAAAAGIVFGAIASATDPASTIDVLWEYRSRGVLTTGIIAIVALDDALAMTLYGVGTAAAQMLTSSGAGSITGQLQKVGIELGGAILLGGLMSLVLVVLLRWIRQPEKNLAFAIGLILLTIGISVAADMDVILSTMTIGFLLVNLVPRRSKELFALMRNFSVPIYVLFFVMVGARLGLSAMPPWLWGIVALYIIGRSGGKILGAYLGARVTHSEPVLQKYLGIGLFAQGGVAVGLSIMASHHLGNIIVAEGVSLGDAIIFGVTATTLAVQLAGPPLVKLAITLAGEIGRNVTEEDVIASWSVRDVMEEPRAIVRENEPLSVAVRRFVEEDSLMYPVVDQDQHVVGMLSLESLKEVLDDQSDWNWLLAADVMAPAEDKVTSTELLTETLEIMRQLKIEQMPVVAPGDKDTLEGVISLRHIRKRVARELLSRQQPEGAPILSPSS